MGKYIDKLRASFEPLNGVKLLDITLSILAAYAIYLVLGFFGLSGFGVLFAAAAILVDAIAAAANKEFKRILSKATAYVFIVLISAGLATYTTISANFVFIALLVFSSTEIIGTIRRIIKKIN